MTDAAEGSADGDGELIDTMGDSSGTPRTVEFRPVVVVGLVVIARCGWPNAKPIAAIPTVPDAQSCSAGIVSTITLRTVRQSLQINRAFNRRWKAQRSELGCIGFEMPVTPEERTDGTASITPSDCES